MYPDLLFYYGIDVVDVIEGRGPPPSFVFQLVLRLPDTSLTTALASGGREHFGWGVDRHLLADLYDATNLTTRAAGNWEKKAPDIPPWPRPRLKPKAPRTVRDVYQMFQRI